MAHKPIHKITIVFIKEYLYINKSKLVEFGLKTIPQHHFQVLWLSLLCQSFDSAVRSVSHRLLFKILSAMLFSWCACALHARMCVHVYWMRNSCEKAYLFIISGTLYWNQTFSQSNYLTESIKNGTCSSVLPRSWENSVRSPLAWQILCKLRYKVSMFTFSSKKKRGPKK